MVVCGKQAFTAGAKLDVELGLITRVITCWAAGCSVSAVPVALGSGPLVASGSAWVCHGSSRV